MSMLSREELEEFEEQIRFEREEKLKAASLNRTKTKVCEDGNTMEWDEDKKAWFPKIDDDFIAKYQMSYGNFEQSNSSQAESVTDQWQSYYNETERLKLEKGEDNPEVVERVDKYNKALHEYYNSDAYREWYAKYMQVSKPTAATTKANKNSAKSLQPGYNLVMADDEEAELALLRAEEEQEEGLPLPQVEDEPVPGDDKQAVKEEGIKKRKTAGPAWYELEESKSTHIYVSGMPTRSDFTEEKFIEVLSKCGLIAHDPLTEKPRCKLYRDTDGKLKGDGRCCYIKVESVNLALDILDGWVIDEHHTMKVERAKFQPKGEFDPNKRRRLTAKEKKKMKEKEESLFKWGLDTSRFIRTKKERTIVVKNAFDEQDFVHDVMLIPEVREQLRIQCAKCGSIKKILVYDTNKEGVCTVTYHSAEEADAAIEFLNKALFYYNTSNGQLRTRQLEVSRWDGKTRFNAQETPEEEAERLAQWDRFLKGEDDDTKDDYSDEQDPQRTPSPPVDDDLGSTDEEEGGQTPPES